MGQVDSKKVEFFVARYSLIPDAQQTIESYNNTLEKEEIFKEWLDSFNVIKSQEVTVDGLE